MQVTLVGRSDVGKRREKNEDSFLVNEDLKLCVVADGMGGHQGGETASRIAVKTVEEVIATLDGDPETTVEEGAHIKPGDFQSYLRYALSSASGKIFQKSTDNAALKGMGTTAVAVLFRNNMVYVANVGDSRVYRIRDREIEQVTEDHSLVEEQVKAGLIAPGDAKSHRLKNIITRSVGFQETVEADVEIRSAHIDDVYILCSDGLSNLVEDTEVCDVVLHNEPVRACERLIDLANERGGDDNITVLIARIDELEAAPGEDETIEI